MRPQLTNLRWNNEEGKYKILEQVGSEADKLGEYVFVIRERTGKPTDYIDIRRN